MNCGLRFYRFFADFLMRFAVVVRLSIVVFFTLNPYILTLEELQIKPKTSIRHKVTPEISDIICPGAVLPLKAKRRLYDPQNCFQL